MHSRFIVRYLATLRGVALMAAAVLAGCPGDVDPPGEFAVRGTATGLLGPVDVELRLGNDVEPLTIAQDGSFAFETLLADGAAYTVALADPDAPCTLRDQTGVVTGADPDIELACTGASLESVVLSGPSLIPIDLDAAPLQAELPLFVQSVTLTAHVATPGDTVTIAGVPVPSGTPTSPIELGLGDNSVSIVVENAFGWERTYRITLHRAPEIAQYAHGKTSSTGAGDQFGRSIALAGDTLVVGAPGEDSAAQGVDGNQNDDAASNSGAVYVFRRTGKTWQQEAYLKASNTGAGDEFGTSVALAGDLLAVGAFAEDSPAQGVNGEQGDDAATTDSGAVYVFRRTGTTWQQEAYLKASNTGAGDLFGASLALSGDTLAVGAWGEASAAQGVDGNQDDDSAASSGAVYVFRRAGTIWQQEAYLKADNAEAGDGFGYGVALSGDDLAIGAPKEDGAVTDGSGFGDDNDAPSCGAVYAFRRTGTTWEQTEYLKAGNGEAGDLFGTSVALAGDILAVGAPAEASAAQGVGGNQDDNTAPGSGAVYVFYRASVSWLRAAYVKASNTGAADAFGASVALAGDALVVGANQESSAAQGVGGDQASDGAPSSGAAYLFRRVDDGFDWHQESYFKASNTGAGDLFGASVAVSGNDLAVGASDEDSAGGGLGSNQGDDDAENSGAVYIFH